jgi:hypothetical protein
VICEGQARDIEIPVQRAQKKFGPSLASGEMKANSSREAVTLRLLKELAKEVIQILALRWIKRQSSARLMTKRIIIESQFLVPFII